MAQAWMVRAGQQQKFLESLVTRFHNRIDELIDAIDDSLTPEEYEKEAIKTRHTFTRDLLIVMLLSPDPEADFGQFANTAKEFRRELDRRIKEFSRASEEEHVLAWRFLIEVIKSSANEFERILSDLEHANPQQMFQAPHSTAEVEVDHD